MRQRSLIVCTAAVLIAHGAVIETLTRYAMGQAIESPGLSRVGERLVLLDRATTASLAPVATAAAEPEAAPPAAETSAASTPEAASESPSAANANANAHAVPGPGLTIYHSPKELDVPLRTRSAPDLDIVNNLPWSGVPIRLRLFIDSQGIVLDTQVLQSAEASEVLARVRAMFLATGFTPGTIHGEPASSYKDIEITVGNPPELPPRPPQ